MSYNGQLILPPAAQFEMRSLLRHIDKGCISGIEPGRGTTRNERLHRELNNVLHSSRYGVELAYGLLSTTFYFHNENLSAKSEKRAPRPITA